MPHLHPSVTRRLALLVPAALAALIAVGGTAGAPAGSAGQDTTVSAGDSLQRPPKDHNEFNSRA
ncbi:hypothetical protein ACN6AT_04330 [Streptomyces sp. JL4002]|uniref:hypothetical protein n=1 Tax=Streptomyces TaxID=1883 RepID=UPI0034196953